MTRLADDRHFEIQKGHNARRCLAAFRSTPQSPTNMKSILILLALPCIAACVSIDLPGVVSDSAKVAKDAYRSVAGKSDEQEAVPSSADSSEIVSNTYIGQESQTPAEVKNLCVGEAAAKLFKAIGKEVPYTVTQNTISTVNNSVAATCRVKANRITQAASPEMK